MVYIHELFATYNYIHTGTALTTAQGRFTNHTACSLYRILVMAPVSQSVQRWGVQIGNIAPRASFWAYTSSIVTIWQIPWCNQPIHAYLSKWLLAGEFSADYYNSCNACFHHPPNTLHCSHSHRLLINNLSLLSQYILHISCCLSLTDIPTHAALSSIWP